MQITIFAAGSRGDVQPCILLGKALQEHGFSIVMAVPENFAGLGRAHGLQVHPLRGDVQQIMEGQTGSSFMESGSSNPIQSIRAIRAMLGPVALQMAEDALEAARKADALISLGVFATLATTIAEVRGIPLIHVEPTPLLPTRSHPGPGWPIQANLGGLHNRLSGAAMLRVIWQWYRPFVNEFRRRLDLAPLSGADFQRILATRPLLGAYSPLVIPRPADAPETFQTTGYWFQDGEPGWQPPAALKAFLDAGPPPIYVGFGSMSGQSAEQSAEIVVAALEKTGQRGLLLTGWGGMRPGSVPESVLIADAAPHGWLFPRMAGVVHHGGAGTTAEGLRAGVPSVIVPFIVDQPFWGQRVRALGVGPAPIPRKRLNSDKLARAIEQSVSNQAMRQKAAELGAAIRAEDGLGNAVGLIKQILGG